MVLRALGVGKGDFMRKLLLTLPLLVLPISAFAQSTPTFEIFAGYSNLYANFNNNGNFDLNGVEGSVQENLNSWFGGVLDVSTHFGTEAGLKTNTQTITYGPVFSYRKHNGVVPFGRVMIGVERGGSNYLNISQPVTRLAVTGGVGLDLQVTPRVALRLIQADYLMTRFSYTRQDNLRLSGGFVFFLGKKR
jgi:Outer membrane protein beta-barrel domain